MSSFALYSRLLPSAVMAVFRGHVIFACEDVSRKFEAHSVRKSLVSGLYGTAVAQGEIDLDSTLADFAIDEQTPLTAAERSATIGQVISARSGVYLPAAYGASQEKGRPVREVTHREPTGSTTTGISTSRASCTSEGLGTGEQGLWVIPDEELVVGQVPTDCRRNRARLRLRREALHLRGDGV